MTLLPRFENVEPVVVRLAPGHARVTTDGSCFVGNRELLGLSPTRGCGGWAAVVERGSEGFVLRGRVPETTATRMEMLAVVEGLRALPAGTQALVVTDALVIEHVHHAWRTGFGPPRKAREKDAELWHALHREFKRLGRLQFKYVRKRDQDSAHQRCHKFAGAEAKALAAEIGHAQIGPKPAKAVKVEQKELRELSREREGGGSSSFVIAFERADAARRRRQVSAAAGSALERRLPGD